VPEGRGACLRCLLCDGVQDHVDCFLSHIESEQNAARLR
jgi:hypothetical protein